MIFLHRSSIFKSLKFLISFRIFTFVCVSMKRASVILLWNIIQLNNVNGTVLLIMCCKTLLIIQRERDVPQPFSIIDVIKITEMLSIVVFKSLLKYQMDGREYLWQRSLCRDAGQECPLD